MSTNESLHNFWWPCSKFQGPNPKHTLLKLIIQTMKIIASSVKIWNPIFVGWLSSINPVCFFLLSQNLLPAFKKKWRKTVTKKVQKLLKIDARAHYVKKNCSHILPWLLQKSLKIPQKIATFSAMNDVSAQSTWSSQLKRLIH